MPSWPVCRFRGRMEYGPRALGNRSIIANPNDATINDWLNERLKRTEFMPFAPASITEHADRLYKGMGPGRYTAEFMTITFDCTDEMKKKPMRIGARPSLHPRTRWSNRRS